MNSWRRFVLAFLESYETRNNPKAVDFEPRPRGQRGLPRGPGWAMDVRRLFPESDVVFSAWRNWHVGQWSEIDDRTLRRASHIFGKLDDQFFKRLKKAGLL